MIYISHRGNIDNIIPNKENTIPYIEKAITLGYDVEIDVRTKDNLLFLGHDTPDNLVSVSWLEKHKNRLWIHAKDIQTLKTLLDTNLRFFFHEKENHTIISGTNLIWSHNILESNEKSIIPLLGMEDLNSLPKHKIKGVCSDYIKILKEKIK
jgi:glycerophosphoryl diester phosphodiesterase